MVREISPGAYWIQECGPSRAEFVERLTADPGDWYEPGRPVHIPQNAYLFVGERTLLFDTLSPAAGDAVLDAVEEVLGERRLDYLVVSHPDVPHAGNALRILRAHPGATLVAPRRGDTHELYHLEDAVKVGPGDELDLGGPLLRFHEATFLDAAIHTWMTEDRAGILFPVDWLGFPHMGGECLRFVDELVAPVTVDRLEEFHGRVMFWLQYVDVEKTQAEVDRLIRAFDPEMIAPAHGLVIREEPARYMAMMKPVVERVASRGRIGVL